ncbi:MAG TPA: hypothetical protein VFV47_03690 [Hyphomicrobiaceae bacterium]|nr:hypothetical protein [Hyphomicrobiaceae bacterium]
MRYPDIRVLPMRTTGGSAAGANGGARCAAILFAAVVLSALRVDGAQAEKEALPVPASPVQASPAAQATDPDKATGQQELLDLGQFLDRLMIAESGGRDTAKNPRSTALGPFQFIESTFLEVVARHFSADVAGLAPVQVLALRTDRSFSRKAAQAFTLENAAMLRANQIAANFANLRLAYLVGASAAVRVLKAEPATPVIGILGTAVVQANPFMAGMTSSDLAQWSARSIAGSTGPEPVFSRKVITVSVPAGSAAAILAQPVPERPRIAVKCNLRLASCRRWLSLAERSAKSAAGKRVRRAATR